VRDYLTWHDQYDDPESGLSWRLRRVQSYIADLLDSTTGPVRVVSACAGDGRDILGVLADRAERGDADRVAVTLIEVHPALVAAARAAATAAGPPQVEVRAVDAGNTTAYLDAVPADLVLLVGIFGNISSAEIERTIRAAPQLCAPGATVVWSRAPKDDHNEDVRRWFVENRFNELDYAEGVATDRVGLGRVRYIGDSVPLVPGEQVFTFLR
jgi:hypothetical protein